MAQTGYTPISIYYSATATNVPTAGNLVAGELAINTADGKLFYKDSAGVVQVIGTKGGVGSSTTTQVLYNSSGLVTGSSSFVFDGTNVGIGTNSPVAKFQVGNTTGSVAGVGSKAYIAINKPIDATSGNYPCRMIDLYAYYPGYNNSNPSATIGAGTDVGSTQNGYITFQTLLANVLNERLRIGPYGDTTFDTSDLICTSGGTSIIGPSYTSQPRVTIGHATGTISGSIYLYFNYAGGSIGSITQAGTTGVLYNVTSDYRLKSDVTPIQNALSTVEALNPVNFTWPDGRKDDGFLAHEIQAVIPNCVTGEKDAVNEDGTPKYQQMDSSGVIPFLVKAIQELNAKVTALEAQLAVK
jgi:hypothetical protein